MPGGRVPVPMRLAAAALVLVLAACASSGGPMTADKARRTFTEQGYADVHNLRPDGSGFAADAIRDGHPVTVVIDGYGIIHTQ